MTTVDVSVTGAILRSILADGGDLQPSYLTEREEDRFTAFREHIEDDSDWVIIG